MKVVGIDLAGRITNPTGLASLFDREVKTRLVYSDEEVIEFCTHEDPDLVAIDAPLSFPEQGNLRKADILLIKRGFRVFPPTFKGMRMLTQRGIRIANELRTKGIEVIEIHPRTSGLLLFETSDRRQWIMELAKRGIRLKKGASEDEIDATLAALTGMLYLNGETEEVGTPNEGMIIIPLPGPKRF